MSTVTFSPDISYIEKFNEEDVSLLAGLNDSRSCYINVNEDFNCLNSSGPGGYIKRILISTTDNELLPKTEKAIETQTFFPGDVLYHYSTKSSMSNKICQLKDDYWLPEDKRFIIKEDLMSVKYTGRIKVIVYNKTEDTIILKKNTSIASLVTSLYSYMDSTPHQYKIF